MAPELQSFISRDQAFQIKIQRRNPDERFIKGQSFYCQLRFRSVLRVAFKKPDSYEHRPPQTAKMSRASVVTVTDVQAPTHTATLFQKLNPRGIETEFHRGFLARNFVLQICSHSSVVIFAYNSGKCYEKLAKWIDKHFAMSCRRY